MADEIYRREEWIDGRWRSLGYEPGTLTHAIEMVTSVHRISGNPVRILKRSGVKTETVFYKRKESPDGTEG
jgi:hypothetical protein